jgi:hypothetical protein
MMGGAFGGHVMSSSSTSSSSSFGNKNHDLVYGIIRQNKDEQGINTGHILTQVFLLSGFVYLFFTFPFSELDFGSASGEKSLVSITGTEFIVSIKKFHRIVMWARNID